jgi:hypothetical protein
LVLFALKYELLRASQDMADIASPRGSSGFVPEPVRRSLRTQCPEDLSISPPFGNHLRSGGIPLPASACTATLQSAVPQPRKQPRNHGDGCRKDIPKVYHAIDPRRSVARQSHPAPSSRGCSWRRIYLRRRSGLGGRFWSQLGKHRGQRRDARRERVAVLSTVSRSSLTGRRLYPPAG